MCPTCRSSVATVYCASCGERALDPRDLTLRGLLGQAVTALVSIDGRFLSSIRTLVAHPGVLTAAWCSGQRRPFVLPLPLFLVTNLVFFATQSLTTANIFSTPLASHLHDQMWSPLAARLLAHHLEGSGTSIEAYAPIFDQAVLLHAKSLIILMVLAFSPLPARLFRDARRPCAVHLVFSLHLYSFLLLLFCVALAVVEVDLRRGGNGLASPAFDHALSVALVVACAVYAWVAIGKVYGARGARRALAAGALALGTAVLVLAYRFVLLPITLFST